MIPYPHTRQDCNACREQDADFVIHDGEYDSLMRLCTPCVTRQCLTMSGALDGSYTITLSRVPDPFGDPLSLPHPPAIDARPNRPRLPCTVCPCHIAWVEIASGLLCRWCLGMHLVGIVPSIEPVPVTVAFYYPEWHSPNTEES